MRRAIVPLAITLAFATGAVLAETRIALQPIAIGESRHDQVANTDLVHRWYEAVNGVIATGETSTLDALLGRDFVSHAGWPDGDARRDAFAAYLIGLHATHPDTRLTVLDLTTANDRVVARIRVDGAERGLFLGLPIAGARIWGAVDVVRIARGRVAEHWSDGAPLARLEPLLTLPVPEPPLASGIARLDRRTYPAGHGELLDATDGFAVVLVERGELRFTPNRLFGDSAWRLTPPTPDAAGTPVLLPPGQPTSLATGDALLVRDGVGQLGNDGGQPAVALVVAVASLDGAPISLGKVSPGAIRTTRPAASPAVVSLPTVAIVPLAGGQAVDLPATNAVVTIGRAVLPIGGVPSHPVAGIELIAVESGSLVLATEGEAAWVHRGDNSATTSFGTALLAPGDGAVVPRHTTARYANAADTSLDLLIATIAPSSATPDAT